MFSVSPYLEGGCKGNKIFASTKYLKSDILSSKHYKANRTFLKFVLVKRSKQFGTLGVYVDVALELLVDAVHLGVIFQGVDFALLQRLGEEFY